MTFCRRALLWAFAALLAVAAPTIHAASDSPARSKLSAELPAGVTLSKASVDQTAGAVRSAIAKDPAMASSILTAAIMAKTPKQGQGKMACGDLAKLTRAAIASDSAEASKLVDTASSTEPDCADTLNNLLTDTTITDPNNPFGPEVNTGFGAGLGAGFPGSPGFVGSAPSGAFALPPVSPSVTSVVNG